MILYKYLNYYRNALLRLEYCNFLILYEKLMANASVKLAKFSRVLAMRCHQTLLNTLKTEKILNYTDNPVNEPHNPPSTQPKNRIHNEFVTPHHRLTVENPKNRVPLSAKSF